MTKITFSLVWCVLLTSTVIRAEILPNNFWPNANFESGDTLELSTGTPTGWKRGGNNAALCEVSVAKAVSPAHSLLVDDTDAAGYAEWYSDLDLTGVVASGDQLDLQWSQIYSTSGGEMRLTVLFFTPSDTIAGTFHFVVNGDSPDWVGDLATSPFQLRKEQIPVGAGAVKMRISLVSGGPQSATGVLMIDDLSVAKVSAPVQEILGQNFRPNPDFEEGESLDLPTGTPTGWTRGGNDASIDQMSRVKSVSSTHSLAVVDTNADGYGEWYSDQPLPCSAREGRVLKLQWFELFDINGGEMRVTILFLNTEGAVVGERHYVATGQSAGWSGGLAASPFVQRNEQLAVPVGAKTLRVSLVSGGAPSVTGTMLVDNFSMAVEPTPATLLFGSIWPNGAFEEGVSLDQATNGLPTGWQRGGNDSNIDLVTRENSASSTHGLAVLDASATGYGEWYANLDLTGRATAGDVLKLQWFELFNVAAGGEMRLTVLFWDTNNTLLSERHFVATGNSSGWSGDLACSTFTKRNEDVTVPTNALRMQVSLVSGGPEATTGLMVIDDFSVAKPLPPPLILARNFWPNPTFEEGAQLDNPTAGSPLGWNRGGSDSRGDVVLHDKATSPTHALALVDTNSNGYSEWYASISLAGIAAAGDSLDLQWQQVFDTTGVMRLTVLFFDAAGAIVGQNNFNVNGQSPDWSGELATSPFEKRNERIAVPEGAARMQIGLASGGGSEVTGTIIVDDLSVATVSSDSDGDGITDVAEATAGTDPLDPNSVLKASLAREASGRRVTWSSVTGKNYALEFSLTPLASDFVALPGAQAIPASNGATSSFLDLTGRTAEAGYYRVKVEQ